MWMNQVALFYYVTILQVTSSFFSLPKTVSVRGVQFLEPALTEVHVAD